MASTCNRAQTPIPGRSRRQGIAAAGNNFKSIDFFGNPAIKPESAFTYNLGAIIDIGNFRAIIDYWSYSFEDQITSVPPNVVATAVAGPGTGAQAVNCAHPLRGLITFNNNNACEQGTTVANDIARVRADVTNGPEADTSGIDLSIVHDFDGVFEGSLRLGLDVSYVLDEDPSRARLELSYDPFIGNPLGRTIQFGLRKEFLTNLPNCRGATQLLRSSPVYDLPRRQELRIPRRRAKVPIYPAG